MLDATQYAPDCMQTTFPGDSAPLKGSLSEDCLYLNMGTSTRYHPKAPSYGVDTRWRLCQWWFVSGYL
ncbi:carboxylesterase family protein [Pseudoalteromonas sp. SG43-3]|nr:carboxylesterase family protein [Pseudoalteromonas sp. SG43-3]